MPFGLALPSPAKLEAAKLALENEIAERRKAEAALAELAEVLEQRVKARTGGSLELTVIFLPNQKSKLIRVLESCQS
jgi:hypothetical protein